MFQDARMSSIALGVGSLFVSMLQTVNTYFNWSKRAEGHRISAIQYSKLYRFLNIEMSLPRHERMSPRDLLKYTKDYYDRLQEISPLVPPETIAEFKVKFDTEKDISKPEETNGLEKITIYNPMHTPKTLKGGEPQTQYRESAAVSLDVPKMKAIPSEEQHPSSSPS